MTGPVLSHLGETRLELGPTRDLRPEGNWRAARDGDGVAWLVLDRSGSDANTISESVIRELSDHVARLENEPPAALVIRSAKPGGFALGADIEEIASMDAAGALDLLHAAHAVLDRIEALPCPTVAVVHGAALGAGFELALACDLRLAVPAARFFYPVMKLGFLPQPSDPGRLAALVGPARAKLLLMGGARLTADEALAFGLVDRLVAREDLPAAVDDLVADALAAASAHRSAIKALCEGRPA